MAPKGAGARAADKARCRTDVLSKKSNDSEDGKLQVQVAKFVEHVQEQGIQEKPDMDLFRKFFTPKQMSHLWVMLQRKRQKSDMSIKDAWQAICQLKGTKNEAKLGVLYDLLVRPGQQWQDRLVSYVDKLEHTQKSKKTKESLTKGQLITQHGFEEAMGMIDSCKVVEAEDSGGDTVYECKKRDTSETHARTRSSLSIKTHT